MPVSWATAKAGVPVVSCCPLRLVPIGNKSKYTSTPFHLPIYSLAIT
ncbi:hypothetical protein QI212_01950 [Staphylococcus saprophyticus]|nr:hypothetical protein [Staphylococcus saprophyticus]